MEDTDHSSLLTVLPCAKERCSRACMGVNCAPLAGDAASTGALCAGGAAPPEEEEAEGVGVGGRGASVSAIDESSSELVPSDFTRSGPERAPPPSPLLPLPLPVAPPSTSSSLTSSPASRRLRRSVIFAIKVSSTL